MILTVAAFLTTFGFGVWIVASLLNYQSIAVIGGILIVGVGAMISMHGLEHRTGEVRSTNAQNETVISYQYQAAEMPQDLPLGLLLSILGGVGVLRALNPDDGGM